MLLSSPMKFIVKSSFVSSSHPVERSVKQKKKQNKKNRIGNKTYASAHKSSSSCHVLSLPIPSIAYRFPSLALTSLLCVLRKATSLSRPVHRILTVSVPSSVDCCDDNSRRGMESTEHRAFHPESFSNCPLGSEAAQGALFSLRLLTRCAYRERRLLPVAGAESAVSCCEPRKS